MSDAKFSQVNVFFNTAFDLGSIVNPIDAARRLLKADVAGGFINYQTGDQEITKTVRDATAAHDMFLNLKEVMDNIETGSAAKAYWRLIRMDPAYWLPVVIRAHLGRTSMINKDEVEGNEDLQEGLQQLLDSEAEFMVTVLGRLAIHESIDRETYHEDYLESLPFVRISLKPFTACIFDTDTAFDVVLTVHRTGVAILTAHGHFESDLDIPSLIALQRPSYLHYSRCEIPTSLIARYSMLLGHAPKDRNEFEKLVRDLDCPDRTTYTCLENTNGSALAGLFDAYRYPLTEYIQGKTYKSIDELHRSLRGNMYYGYYMQFLTVTCERDLGSYLEKHANSVAKIVMGLDSSALRDSKIAEVLSSDLSITKDSALFLTEAGSTVISCAGKETTDERSLTPEELASQYMTTSVLDSLIFQRIILDTYRTQLGSVQLTESGMRRLETIKRDLLLALNEFDAIDLSHYGSVHQLIESGQNYVGINKLRSAFDRQTALLQELVQVATSRRKEQQEWVTRVAVTLVSALLSFQAASSIVSTVTSWSTQFSYPYPRIVAILAEWLIGYASARPVFVTVLLYTVIFVASMIALWSGRLVNSLLPRSSVMPSTPEYESTPQHPARMPIRVQRLQANEEPSASDEED